jgi:ribosomal protein S11
LRKQRLRKLVKQFRTGFIGEITIAGLHISSIIDASNVSFNGCKNKKKKHRSAPRKKGV